jgi:hypothetical protein
MTVSNDVHKDSQHRSPRCCKAAAAGGLRVNCDQAHLEAQGSGFVRLDEAGRAT